MVGDTISPGKARASNGLIPPLVVVQPTKDKVRPVMDYIELNQHVDAFTTNADVCATKLREWR